MTEEVWKDVVGYEGTYQVSNIGRVRTLRYRSDERIKIMKVTIGNRGYRTIRLCSARSPCRRNFLVHRLVMQAFVGSSSQEVNHRNGIKSDNRLENLEYVTRAENIQHAYLTGLNIPLRGERKPSSKLKAHDVLEIRKMIVKGISNVAIGRKFGLHHGTVAKIRLGKLWSHLSRANGSADSKDGE